MSPTEPIIRLSFFIGILVSMSLWEAIAPLRPRTQGKLGRWVSNLGLAIFNTIVLRLIPALGAVSAAELCATRGWGLFHNAELPGWTEVIVSFVLLDLAIYLQHVMFHALPVLWRLHMVHHADLDFDASTGVRFHTVEILLSMIWKIAVVILLGAPAIAVVVFEVVLNASSLFNHGNVRMPRWLDRILRSVIVTPDMHRVHHSVLSHETNSNFGFNLPWWDYLLGTYRSQPAAGHLGMTIGLAQFRDSSVERLPWMLLLPILGKLGEYPMSRLQNESNSVLPEARTNHAANL